MLLSKVPDCSSVLIAVNFEVPYLCDCLEYVRSGATKWVVELTENGSRQYENSNKRNSLKLLPSLKEFKASQTFQQQILFIISSVILSIGGNHRNQLRGSELLSKFTTRKPNKVNLVVG